MIIEFNGIPPSLKNSKQVFCRNGKPTVIPSKAYTTWHKEQSERLKNIPKNIGRELDFIYTFYIPLNKDGTKSKKKFDYSNKIESINDLLVDLGIIEDDNYDIISFIQIFKETVEYGKGKVALEIFSDYYIKN